MLEIIPYSLKLDLFSWLWMCESTILYYSEDIWL